LCHVSEGRNCSMRSRRIRSRMASRRSQSTTRRCISGSGRRLRSGRGGKSPARPAAPAPCRSALELLTDQEAVGQHHQHAVAVEPPPQPPLSLAPAHRPLGPLVKLPPRGPPVRVAPHRLQRCPRPEVAPVVLALGFPPAAGLPADQPPGPAPAVGQYPP